MKKVTALLLALGACAALTAACAKSSDNTSSSSSPAAATAAPAGGNMAATTASALPIPLAELPSAKVAVGNVANGAKVFTANCESCHGAGGKNGTVGPSLAGIGIKPGQVAYMVLNPAAIDKESGMPKLTLSSKEIADVAAYVASLK